MNVVFCEEDVSDLWEEAESLTAAHWLELAHFKDIAFNPDKEAYRFLEQTDKLRCYTARSDGKLIGYQVFIVQPSLHYRQSLQAMDIGLYLDPEWRGKRIGLRSIKEADRRLAAQKVQVVYRHARRDSSTGKLLIRVGYDLADEVYVKRLDI